MFLYARQLERLCLCLLVLTYWFVELLGKMSLPLLEWKELYSALKASIIFVNLKKLAPIIAIKTEHVWMASACALDLLS